jgi:hypothetical protein
MDDLSSPPPKAQDDKDDAGYRPLLIAGKAQDLLGARCTRIECIARGKWQSLT